MRTRLLFILLFGFAAGCGGTPTLPAGRTPTTSNTPHSHGGGGVAGGALATWGEEEFHVEFTVDHTTSEATVYVLDGSAKKVAAIPAKSITLSLAQSPPVVVKLDAKPQDGDPAGQSSRFVGKHPALAKEVEFTGSISGEVNGKKYTGDFKEVPDGKK